jgi:RimJ/RimL family protein N-acetyltransferase
MSPEEIDDMVSWRYEPPYDFYDGDIDPILNPERFFAVYDDSGTLVGNYYFEQKGDVVEYGLGLRPELTGMGLGLEFFRAGLDVARARFSPTTITLAVAAFNARAITVYERAGFRETGRHVRTFERFGDVEFVDMVLAE